MTDEILSLLNTKEPPELGPGPRPGVESESQLDGKLKAFFSAGGLPVPKQQLLRALVLLWHDHLDSAHSISQDIHNSDGSFVHAIMHRREPDYGNSKYWFHRVGKHPAFSAIATEVTALFQSNEHRDLLKILVPDGQWDPFAFVDSCERATHEAPESEPLLREIQRIETQSLMKWIIPL